MFKKTTLAAAALATTIAAATVTLPVTSANAAPPVINLSIGIGTPGGYIQFGTGPYGGFYPQPAPLSCFQAKQVLKSDFKKVSTVECNGGVYTFKVKKHFVGPWKTVKLNRMTGHYWIV